MPHAKDPARRSADLTPNPGTCRVRCRFPYVASAASLAEKTGPLGRRGLRVEPWVQPSQSHPVHRDPDRFGPMQALRLGSVGMASAALVGCAGLMPPQPVQQLSYAPVLRMDSGTWTADGAYAAGKAALAQGRTHEALMLFERAAVLRPRWDDAVNGQVVTLARLGRTADAIEVARSAIASGARAAELHGNLGLMLMRSGRSDEAWARLEQASRIDPENTTWSLALARRPAAALSNLAQRAAQPAAAPLAASAVTVPVAAAAVAAPVAPVVVAQAPAEAIASPAASPVVSVPAATAARPAPVIVTAAAAPSAPAAPVPPAAAAPEVVRAPTVAMPSPQLRWDRSESNVLALRLDAAPAVALASPTPAELPKAVQLADASQAAPRLRFSIEVSNGAGRTGLAKGTADALRTAGMKPWRITNHSNFKVAQTEVQYRGKGDAAAARQLARKLGVTVALVQNPNLHASVNLRVVLGKDMASLPANKRLLADGPEQLELFSA